MGETRLPSVSLLARYLQLMKGCTQSNRGKNRQRWEQGRGRGSSGGAGSTPGNRCGAGSRRRGRRCWRRGPQAAGSGELLGSSADLQAPSSSAQNGGKSCPPPSLIIKVHPGLSMAHFWGPWVWTLARAMVDIFCPFRCKFFRGVGWNLIWTF